jgi:hypothetical protein
MSDRVCTKCEFHLKGHCFSVNYMMKVNFVKSRQAGVALPVIPKSQTCEFFRSAADSRPLQINLL